jgi:hypothetical protein
MLGASLLMIPGRWALAADSTPAPNQPAAVENSPQGGTRGEPPLFVVDPLQLKGSAFYDALGRDDLARRYRTRAEVKGATRVLGGVALTVGVAWLVLDAFGSAAWAGLCAGAQGGSSCKQDAGPPLGVDILLGVGLAALVAPSFWSTDPLNDDEKRALVESVTRARFQPRDVHVSAAPALEGQGATLRLAGRF